MTDKLHNGRAPKRAPTRTRCVSTNTFSSTPKPNNLSNMFSGMRAIASPCARPSPDKSCRLLGMWLLADSQLLIIPFYKKGCQDKYLPHDGKTAGKWSCRPASVMERDAVSFPFPQIHRAFVTTLISSQRRQAERLCRANHGSIRDFSPIAFSGCPRGHRVSRKTWYPKHAPNGIMDTHPRTRASGEPTGHYLR